MNKSHSLLHWAQWYAQMPLLFEVLVIVYSNVFDHGVQHIETYKYTEPVVRKLGICQLITHKPLFCDQSQIILHAIKFGFSWKLNVPHSIHIKKNKTKQKKANKHQRQQQLLLWADYSLQYPSVSYFLQMLQSLINRWFVDVCKIFATQRIIIHVKIYITWGVFSLSGRYGLSTNWRPPSIWWPFITLSATKIFQKKKKLVK